MNEVIDVINKRVSLRRYEDQPIPKEVMDTIIQSAIQAPTAGNMMLYSIIHVKDPQLKKDLAQTCDNQAFIATAPELLIFMVDWQKWEDYYALCDVESIAAKKGNRVHHADTGEFMLSATDAIIAAQNAVIAAESLGVGSCYIGDIVEKYETHKQLLNLPDYVFPIAMLTLGYYPENMKRVYRSRFSSEYVVFEDKYQQLSETSLLEMFKDRDYPKNMFTNYGQYMYSRKSGTDFIEEMTRSIDKVLSVWKEKNK